MYLDGIEPSYSINDGLNYYGGTNQTSSYFYVGRRYDGSLPANGIIDDLKIYGYQYQKFEYGFSLFSKMGSLNDIQNPIRGNGGVTGGTVSYVTGQQGNGTKLSSSSIGVVGFPTTNLNPLEDTIDLWYKPSFNIEDNTYSNKYLFLYYIDTSNYAFIKVDMDALNFTITENGNSHILKTIGLKNWDWYHIVCTWGPDGMHIYINDKEASYSDYNGLSYIGGLPTTGMPTYFGIGNTGATAGNYCDGIIDELRVYGYQGSPSYLEFLVDCPVDIQVIDPLGRIVDKFRSEIWGAKYIEQDFNSDGSIDDKIIIPNPRSGNYTVLVIPEPGADPADTYTLKVINGETPLIITQNTPIGDIDGEETFGITFTSEGIKLAKLLSPEDHAVLSGPVTFSWQNIGFDGFRLEFSSDKTFRKNKRTYPQDKERRWISETQYTPTEKEWRQIERIAHKNGVIYWRVTAIDAEGNTGNSETRSFSLR